MALQSLTGKLTAGEDLSASEVAVACDGLLSESASLEDRANFLKALRTKGETPAEVAAFVTVLLERAVRPTIPESNLLDVCGTGGDKSGVFNISTTVMFVAAACGARVVKHGNRGITSKSGGADVLEALGVKVDLPPERAGEAVEMAGCCFLFAPLYHPAFQAVAPVRHALAAEGFTTIFNLLGPLLNPARPDFQLAGIFDPLRLPLYAETFRLLGRQSAITVHGTGPNGIRLDEVSTLGTTEVCALSRGTITRSTFHAETFGLPLANLEALRGGSAKDNAKITLEILRGEDQGPRRDIVLANASMALVASEIAGSFPEALILCREAIAEGRALHRLEKLRSVQ